MKRLSDVIKEIERIMETEGDIPVFQYTIKDFSGTTEYTALFDAKPLTYAKWVKMVQLFPDKG